MRSYKILSLEITRGQERELRGSTRELDRQVLLYTRECTKLENEIRAAGKRGDIGGAKNLANQLIRMREQKQRLLQVKSQLVSTQHALKTAATRVCLNTAISTATSTMTSMNEHMSLESVQQGLAGFEAQMTESKVKAEAVDDVFESIFEEDSEKEIDIMNKIYDEIGLEVAKAPAVPIKAKFVPEQISEDQVNAFIRSYEKEMQLTSE